jgi:tetratricopeptide (TPR) repeat protein
MSNQASERSWLDELFEASYDPALTYLSKDEARAELIDRLEELTSGIDRELPGDELVRELDSRLGGGLFRSDYMEAAEGTYPSLFGIDFALRRRGNCVVYADAIVSALEHIGREDVIEKLRVKYTGDHVWLAYKDDSSSFEINANGRKSDEEHTIEALIAANWNNKATALCGLGRYEEANECCDKALEIDPKDIVAWNNKGVTLARLGRYEEANECCDKALEIDPKDIVAWNNKGNALIRLGRYEEAIECYDEVLKIDPKDIFAWNNKGAALIRLGRYEEAIKCFDETLEIDPKDIVAWNNKGAALCGLGRYEEANECYKKARSL